MPDKAQELIEHLVNYQNTIQHKNLVFEDYLDQTIFFEIDYLIKMLKDKESE